VGGRRQCTLNLIARLHPALPLLGLLAVEQHHRAALLGARPGRHDRQRAKDGREHVPAVRLAAPRAPRAVRSNSGLHVVMTGLVRRTCSDCTPAPVAGACDTSIFRPGCWCARYQGADGAYVVWTNTRAASGARRARRPRSGRAEHPTAARCPQPQCRPWLPQACCQQPRCRPWLPQACCPQPRCRPWLRRARARRAARGTRPLRGAAHLGAARERARAVRQVVPAHDGAKLHAARAAAPGRHPAGPSGAATSLTCAARATPRPWREQNTHARRAARRAAPAGPACRSHACGVFKLDAHRARALTQGRGLQDPFTQATSTPLSCGQQSAGSWSEQRVPARSKHSSGARARTLLAGSGAHPAGRAHPAAGTCGAPARRVSSPCPCATRDSLFMHRSTCFAGRAGPAGE
jgi:hypothetical protein